MILRVESACLGHLINLSKFLSISFYNVGAWLETKVLIFFQQRHHYSLEHWHIQPSTREGGLTRSIVKTYVKWSEVKENVVVGRTQPNQT